MLLNYVYIIVSHLHQRSKLKSSEEKVREMYNGQEKQIKDIVTIEQVLDAQKYQTSQNFFDILFKTMTFLFDFFAILFDIPAMIWYGWLQVLAENGHCDDGPYGIWMQPQIGLLFFLTYYTAYTLYLLPLRYCDTLNDRKYGMNKGNCCSFLMR